MYIKHISLIFLLFLLFMFYCFSHLTAEESDSDSDEDLEGGVRHDLMMADEKVPSRIILKTNALNSKLSLRACYCKKKKTMKEPWLYG